MTVAVICPHCGAVQGERPAPLCWLCRQALDAPPSAPPPPPRPLRGDGFEGRATEAALVAGMVSVGVGALMVSTGFGMASTLIVVLPCAWVLGDMVLSRPASKAPAVPAAPRSPWMTALKVVGAVAAAIVLVPLAMMVALFVCCAALAGGFSVFSVIPSASMPLAALAVVVLIVVVAWGMDAGKE